ncbi:hypothetical protein Hte_004797 [Hypoxylon texense]
MAPLDGATKTASGSVKPRPKKYRHIGAALLSHPTILWSSGKTEEGSNAGEFRLEKLVIDAPRICAGLNCHLSFKVKEGYEMNGLPKFGDLTRYDVREKDELQLWKLEVHRLVEAVKSEDPPLLEGSPEWLLRAFDPDEGAVRYNRKIKLDKHNDEVYHALVNYVTATFARLLLRTMNGMFWVDNCLDTLAKFAAKLKVVGADLPQAVSKTFEARIDFQARMDQLARTQHAIHPTHEGNDEADEDSPRAKQKKALKADLETTGSRYFVVMDAFHDCMGLLLKDLIGNLTWNEEFGEAADEFETSAIIYDTGLRGIKTQLCQERDGSIGIAADNNVILCASAAFEACKETWTRLPSGSEPNKPYTSVRWTWTKLDIKDDILECSAESRDLLAMKDVITSLVPYLMYCGGAPTMLSLMAHFVILISDPAKPVKYYAQSNILASARFRTSEYKPRYKKDSQWSNVFETKIAQEGALTDMEDSGDKGRLIQEQRQRRNAKFREAMDQVETWIIDERSIIIPSLWYSWAVL